MNQQPVDIKTVHLTNDPVLMGNPFPLYRQWRERSPILPGATPDGAPIWILTRYADVRSTLADPRLSLNKQSSKQGYRGYALPQALDANLLNMDPPDHSRLRRLVNKAFTPRRVEQLAPSIEELAEHLLDTATTTSPADLVKGFAEPLPLTVIGELLGVPAGDREAFRSWTNTLVTPKTASDARDAVTSMVSYLVTLIDAKRAEPTDDLLSAMIAARDGEDHLAEDELISLTFLILWAGYELTVYLIGNLILELLRHPQQMDLLRSHPDLAPSAVDEAIRYTAPGPFAIRRFPTEDATIAGVGIPAGDTLLLCLASAHRDPTHFPEPDRFDIQRTNSSPLLGFGHGIHYCLGAPLARLEAAIAVNTLLKRHPRLTLAAPPAELRWRPSFRSRGLLALPVNTDG